MRRSRSATGRNAAAPTSIPTAVRACSSPPRASSWFHRAWTTAAASVTRRASADTGGSSPGPPVWGERVVSSPTRTRGTPMAFWICATCGVEHAERVAVCAICADERQWVPAEGQRWTTLDELGAAAAGVEVAELEPDLFGLTVTPKAG